jgi:hypothetical protein
MRDNAIWSLNDDVRIQIWCEQEWHSGDRPFKFNTTFRECFNNRISFHKNNSIQFLILRTNSKCSPKTKFMWIIKFSLTCLPQMRVKISKPYERSKYK